MILQYALMSINEICFLISSLPLFIAYDVLHFLLFHFVHCVFIYVHMCENLI